MFRRVARLAGGAALGLVLAVVAASPVVAGAFGVSAAVAGAPGLSACTSKAGVLVAVDFSHFGGAVDLGCAAGAQVDGVRATEQAGFLTVGDEESGDAFVCRIGVAAEGERSERPTPSEDPCVSTPPASAYWAFWVADAGQTSWSYSEVGAASYKPPPGSIEGWAFGSGGQPSVSPAQVRAKASQSSTSTSTTTSTSTPTSTTSTTSTTAAATHTRSTVVGSGAHGLHRHNPSREPTATGSSRSRAQLANGSHSHIVVVASDGVQATADPRGTSTGLVATLVIVGAMSAGGGLFARRRRRKP